MLTGSVSQAADNLFLTQPAVSLQISRLEKELELKLFNRLNGRLQPVPEAEYLFDETTLILERIENVQKNLSRVRKLETGQINIVSMVGPSFFFIPQLISEFLKDREDVKISLYSHSSFQTQQLLSSQRYDVGIVDLIPDPAPALIDYDKLDYQCVCALSVNDPLATKSSISAKDLDGKPLALLIESHPISEQLKDTFQQQGLTMNRRFETRYFIPLLTFVERNLGYAIVDPLTVDSYRLYCKNMGSIVFLPFNPAINYSVSIVTPSHRPLSTLVNSFITYLKSELQALQ